MVSLGDSAFSRAGQNSREKFQILKQLSQVVYRRSRSQDFLLPKEKPKSTVHPLPATVLEELLHLQAQDLEATDTSLDLSHARDKSFMFAVQSRDDYYAAHVLLHSDHQEPRPSLRPLQRLLRPGRQEPSRRKAGRVYIHPQGRLQPKRGDPARPSDSPQHMSPEDPQEADPNGPLQQTRPQKAAKRRPRRPARKKVHDVEPDYDCFDQVQVSARQEKLVSRPEKNDPSQ